MTRPATLVGVVGTGTDVGKTWVTARLLECLAERGTRASARKPVQSYDADEIGATDAEVLGRAGGEDPHAICPAHRWYAMPMAPPMAAEGLGQRSPTLSELLAELEWAHPRPDVGFVETVGGVRSPLADDGDSRDLVLALEPDVVLVVAHAGLGVIDSVRLAIGALAPVRPVVFLNHFGANDDLHRRNLAWLRERDGTVVETSVAELATRIARL